MGEPSYDEGPSRSEVRISDAERHAVVSQLQTHFVDGRLTLDEFAERSGLAYKARTAAELEPLLADLPSLLARPPAPPPTTAPNRPSGEVEAPRTGRTRVVAIMSGAARKRRWRIDRPITAFAFWGSVTLDLREAAIGVARVEIRAWALMGSVDVIVPEGVPVDHGGFLLMGSNDARIRDVEAIAGAPTVEVRGYGLWGSVSARNPRRSSEARRAQREERRRQRDEQRRGGRVPPAVPMPPAPGAPPAPPGRPAPAARAELAPPLLDDLVPILPERAEAVLRRLGLTSGGYATAPAEGGTASGAASEPEAPLGTVTMLFTDICGSTEMAEALGDRRWVDILQDHNRLIRQQVQEHGGTEIKVHGDGFMLAFASARSALLAAIAIQHDLAAYRRTHPDAPVEVRIGAHTGEVVASDGDYFGRNVILAARLADRAGTSEILVSNLVKELTDSSGDLLFDDGEEVELKGLSRPWRVHRVHWT